MIGTEVNLLEAAKRIDAVIIQTEDQPELFPHQITGKLTINEFKSKSSSIDSSALVQASGYQEIVEDELYKENHSEQDIRIVITGFKIYESLMGKDQPGFRTFHNVKIEKMGNGVYNVIGYGYVPTHIVLLNELVGDEYACLRMLGKNATADDYRKFYRQIRNLGTPNTETWKCIQAVSYEFITNNRESFDNYSEEDKKMLEVFKKYTETYIDEACFNAYYAGKGEGRAETIAELWALVTGGDFTQQGMIDYLASMKKMPIQGFHEGLRHRTPCAKE